VDRGTLTRPRIFEHGVTVTAWSEERCQGLECCFSSRVLIFSLANIALHIDLHVEYALLVTNSRQRLQHAPTNEMTSNAASPDGPLLLHTDGARQDD